MQLDYVDDFLEYAKRQLRVWGAVQRKELGIEMNEDGNPILHGWDRVTIEHTIMQYGGETPRGTGQRREPERQDVILTDAIVSRAPKSVKLALYYKYVYKLSVRQGARMLATGRTQYESLCDSGASFVAGGYAAQAK